MSSLSCQLISIYKVDILGDGLLNTEHYYGCILPTSILPKRWVVGVFVVGSHCLLFMISLWWRRVKWEGKKWEPPKIFYCSVWTFDGWLQARSRWDEFVVLIELLLFLLSFKILVQPFSRDGWPLIRPIDGHSNPTKVSLCLSFSSSLDLLIQCPNLPPPNFLHPW